VVGCEDERGGGEGEGESERVRISYLCLLQKKTCRLLSIERACDMPPYL
jgi:hypothetical protein